MRSILSISSALVSFVAFSLAGCSGTASPGPADSQGGSIAVGGTEGSGGDATIGGSSGLGVGGQSHTGGSTTAVITSLGGASSGGANPTGGSRAAGGTTAPITGGAAPTGGSPSTGGTMSTSTGNRPTGGVTSTGGSRTTGGTAVGGTMATGGIRATGGAATGGGPAAGGAATGGSRSTGGAATGGVATGGAATGGSTSSGVFGQCRFHFGTLESIAKASNAATIAELDFVTPGWMLGTFNQSYVCTETASGAALAGKVPVDVTYIAANYVKGAHGLCDCNVTSCGSSGGRTNDLCNYGAQYITQDWANILQQYTSNSTGFANCLGGRPIIFEMEPDWYQYTITNQTQPWSVSTAATNLAALVNALKANLPQAKFSMDISPWIANNGSGWYPSFNMSLFTFINTSGGGTDANNTKIRSSNAMTWAGVNQVTGKPILADTGYGAAGSAAGMDANWNVASNINSRIADGVISISQYNPCPSGQSSCSNANTWGPTITSLRSQLNAPKYCP